MPRIIAMPTTPNFSRSTFTLNRAVSNTVSPFTGATRTQEYDFAGWSSTVSLPPLRRDVAANWQAFLLMLKGSSNYFLFVDPDGKVPQGTYSADALKADARINSGSQVTSVTLSFSGSTITAGTAIFDGLVAGDYFFVEGATNADNNGTHQIATKTSDTVVVTSTILTTEANTASCSVKQNVKGAEALSLLSTSNSATGTIKKGDYLAIYDGTSITTNNAIQLVMATEDASRTEVSGGADKYSLSIQPKLRADFANNNRAGFAQTHNQSRFRLSETPVEWSANNNSVFGISFSCAEVI